MGTRALNTRTRFPGGGRRMLASSFPGIVPAWGSTALWAGVKRLRAGHSTLGRGIGKGSGGLSKGYSEKGRP